MGQSAVMSCGGDVLSVCATHLCVFVRAVAALLGRRRPACSACRCRASRHCARAGDASGFLRRCKEHTHTTLSESRSQHKGDEVIGDEMR